MRPEASLQLAWTCSLLSLCFAAPAVGQNLPLDLSDGQTRQIVIRWTAKAIYFTEDPSARFPATYSVQGSTATIEIPPEYFEYACLHEEIPCEDVVWGFYTLSGATLEIDRTTGAALMTGFSGRIFYGVGSCCDENGLPFQWDFERTIDRHPASTDDVLTIDWYQGRLVVPYDPGAPDRSLCALGFEGVCNEDGVRFDALTGYLRVVGIDDVGYYENFPPLFLLWEREYAGPGREMYLFEAPPPLPLASGWLTPGLCLVLGAGSARWRSRAS